ncbi:MAG: hypothetical protein WAW13_03960 [Minisyncoccia bacterium]
MKPDIDIIVKEILAENPELALEASALRALVIELSEKQPLVTVDPAFRARLRAELLKGAVTHKEKRSTLPWWLIYTVPVGVTALLLLVMQPSYTTTPIEPTSTDSFDVGPSMMQIEGGATMKAPNGSNLSREAGFSEDTMAGSAPFSSNDFFTAAFMPNRQAVRFSYLSLSVPAFISVSGPEGNVLVSELILPGEHTNLVLPVIGMITSGADYTATLYYDNGDAVFTEGNEIMALNPTGTPISMILVAP